MRMISRTSEGLSPRVRGNLAQLPAAAFACGSIPACAGEPALGHFSVGVVKVYPRVCGGTARAAVSPR